MNLLDYNASFLVWFLTCKEEKQKYTGKSQYFDVCPQREMELPLSDKEAAKCRQLPDVFRLRDTFSLEKA